MLHLFAVAVYDVCFCFCFHFHYGASSNDCVDDVVLAT